MPNSGAGGVILIKNGRVYDHAGDVDFPAIADLLIIDGVIAAVRSGIAAAVERGEQVAELESQLAELTGG